MKCGNSVSLYRLIRQASMVLGLIVLLNSCAMQKPVSLPFPKQPAGTPAPPSGVYSPPLGPAKSLYRAAEDFLAAGDAQSAEMRMERALRIEPRNGHYWYTMARIKYRQGEYSQAVQLCLKSKSLAGRDRPHLLMLNDNLISKARNHLQ